jgi:hypothetical protein
MTEERAAVVKGMLHRGDRKVWIYSHFEGKMNFGRISDVENGRIFAEVSPSIELPPSDNGAKIERKVTSDDAAIIKGMLRYGYSSQDISAWFEGQINLGRIADVKAGRMFSEVAPILFSQAPPRDSLELDFDADYVTHEGTSGQRWQRFRTRSIRLRLEFLRSRASSMHCDSCGNPHQYAGAQDIVLKSLFDVHHRNHLRTGERETRLSDLELLCPCCHRLRHMS